MDKLEFINREKRKRGLIPGKAPPEDPEQIIGDTPPEDSVSSRELFGNEDLFGVEMTEFDEDSSRDANVVSAPAYLSSAERKERVQRYLKLYLKYMHPEKPLSSKQEQYLLDDLIESIRVLCSPWATATAKRRSAYRSGDEEDGMQLGCIAVYEALQRDKATGTLRQYPLAYYQTFFRNRTIDYFRTIYGTVPKSDSGKPRRVQKVYPDLSIEAIAEWENESQMDRLAILSVNPYEEKRDQAYYADLSSRILLLYYRELMNYSFEPQKPIILMYGRVLFQLSKKLHCECSILHPDSWDADRHCKLIEQAAASTKLSSTDWAYEKMGIQNLEYLGNESEKILQLHVDPSLLWGSEFRRKMTEPAAYNARYEENGHILEQSQTWGQLIFTQTFPDWKKANHWITDINKSTIEKASRALIKDRELSEFILSETGTDNLMRLTLKKQAKEAEK